MTKAGMRDKARRVVEEIVERRGRTAALLACIAFLVYNANFRGITAGDAFPARFLPFSILADRSLNLDSVYEATRMGDPRSYWIMTSVDGHPVSMYPIVTPILVTPLYVPAVLFWTGRGRDELILERLGEMMEKAAASFVASLCVAMAYLLIRRRLVRKDAIFLTLAFAFGTNTWVTSSQGLWQHGAAELFLLGALLAATSVPSARAVFVAGACSGLLVANRPPDIVLAAGVFAFVVLFWAPRKTWLFVVAAGTSAFPFFLYNWITFHDWGGGYAVTFKVTLGGTGGFFRNPLHVGLAGLLISPGKGLLVFCPFFLFLAGLFRWRFARPEDRRLAACLAAAVTAQLFLYARTDWRGGSSYGPRFLTDMVPALLFLLVPVVAALSFRLRLVFIGTVAVAVAIQAVGAFCYPGGASDVYGNVWKDAPFIQEARAGVAPPVFLRYVRKGLRRYW